MMTNNKIKKLNNHGSTLIMVVVIVTFIAILGTVCISSAMLNLKMKATDRESKKTFYTAEEAVDEIYNGLGKLSIQTYDPLYQTQMSKLTKQTTNGGFVYAADNTLANTELREAFARSMVVSITGDSSLKSLVLASQPFDNPTYKASLITLLKGYLEHPAIVNVESIGRITLEATKNITTGTGLNVYTIKFADCVVRYKNVDGYFAEVTFDGVIALPDNIIDFTNDPNKMLKSFEKYALIGDQSVEISANKSATVNAGIYAGSSGLNLIDGSSLAVDNASSDSNIVTSNNITLKNGAKFNALNATNIWCTNIITDKNGMNQAINISDICKTCVKDDLQIDGDMSSAKVGGYYYGYSYQGDDAKDDNLSSSAVIVNGSHATIDFSAIKSLVLGGRAYIDMSSATTLKTYSTGESLSLRGNQRVYLVPSNLVTSSYGARNPYPIDSTDVKINLSSSTFPGYDDYLGDPKYTTTTINGQLYAYLNFKTKAKEVEYLNSILNTNTYGDMKSIIVNNPLDQKTIFAVNTDTILYTNAALVARQNDKVDGSSSVDSQKYSIGTFATDTSDLANRYELICKTLYSTPLINSATNDRQFLNVSGAKITSIPETVGAATELIDITDASDSVFTNFINSNYTLAKIGDVGDGTKYMLTRATDNSACIATTGNIIIGSGGGSDCYDIKNGIVISYGSVTVNQDFHGIIIAAKSIYVANNVTVDNKINGSTSIDAFLNNDDYYKEFKEMFYAWNSASTGSPSGAASADMGLTYKDIVNFVNWTKTNVTAVE